MTREEAIELLSAYGVPLNEEKFQEAIDMAISALTEAEIREQYGQNYETDDYVKLAELVHLNHELEQQLADRPHGEWVEPQLIYTDAHKVTCTNCGERVVIVGETNFCPNCGARMKGGTE